MIDSMNRNAIDKKRCDICGSTMTNLRLYVNLSFIPEYKLETGEWKKDLNATQSTESTMCEDCFYRLCDQISKMNEKYPQSPLLKTGEAPDYDTLPPDIEVN